MVPARLTEQYGTNTDRDRYKCHERIGRAHTAIHRTQLLGSSSSICASLKEADETKFDKSCRQGAHKRALAPLQGLRNLRCDCAAYAVYACDREMAKHCKRPGPSTRDMGRNARKNG